PISSERVVMRQTLLAGVLEVAATNLKHADNVRLFEVGPVFLTRSGEKLPDEPRRLAMGLNGPRPAVHWGAGVGADNSGFFDLKGIVESLAEDLHLPDITYERSKAGYLHPGKSAELLVAGAAAGSFGEMHPRVAEAYGLGDRRILAAEFDLEAILAAVP